jgi:tRNA dimethylallyltransferase
MFEPALEPVDFETIPPLADAWYLTGPTASGKTAVGLELAERLEAEIISLDSMSVFRGMDIGTAKPTLADRARVPHHLVDVVDPDQEFSLAEYVRRAHTAAQEIRERGRTVLVVGGTPLYLKAMLRGLYQGPPPDWEFRRAVEEEVARVGLAALRERLELVDPLSAAKLHPHDQRRMIRALEVHRLTGRPLSHLQTQFEEASTAAVGRVFALSWPRGELHARIDARVERMFELGLIEEVRGLLARYGTLGRTAAQAVGYQEVQEFLAGTSDLASTKAKVKAATHQFARRQETWFRSLRECRSVPQQEHDSPATVADAILSLPPQV